MPDISVISLVLWSLSYPLLVKVIATARVKPEQRSWWNVLALSACEKLRIRQDLCLPGGLEPLVEEVDTELTHLSVTERWRSQVPATIVHHVIFPSVFSWEKSLLWSVAGKRNKYICEIT